MHASLMYFHLPLVWGCFMEGNITRSRHPSISASCFVCQIIHQYMTPKRQHKGFKKWVEIAPVDALLLWHREARR